MQERILKIYNFLKTHIQWFIYAVIVAAAIGTIIGSIFGSKSCSSDDTIETVEAQYFMNETVVVHDNFEIIIYYAKTVTEISYLKSSKDTEYTTLYGNYIEVNVDVTKKADSTEKDHELDTDDFKLRDHSGVYLPLNDIMALLDINALDVYINTDEDGLVKSDCDFNSKNAIKDYSWVGTKLTNGQTNNITLFFDMSEGYQVETDLMLLEVDFYTGASGIKKGEDIVLLNCVRE